MMDNPPLRVMDDFFRGKKGEFANSTERGRLVHGQWSQTEVENGCHAKSLGLEGEEVPVVREPAKIARVFPLRAKRWGSHVNFVVYE